MSRSLIYPGIFELLNSPLCSKFTSRVVYLWHCSRYAGLPVEAVAGVTPPARQLCMHLLVAMPGR